MAVALRIHHRPEHLLDHLDLLHLLIHSVLVTVALKNEPASTSGLCNAVDIGIDPTTLVAERWVVEHALRRRSLQLRADRAEPGGVAETRGALAAYRVFNQLLDGRERAIERWHRALQTNKRGRDRLGAHDRVLLRTTTSSKRPSRLLRVLPTATNSRLSRFRNPPQGYSSAVGAFPFGKLPITSRSKLPKRRERS